MMLITIALVLLVVLKTQLFSLSLVMTTTVNLVILLLMVHLYTSDPLWDGKGCGSLEGVMQYW